MLARARAPVRPLLFVIGDRWSDMAVPVNKEWRPRGLLQPNGRTIAKVRDWTFEGVGVLLWSAFTVAAGNTDRRRSRGAHTASKNDVANPHPHHGTTSKLAVDGEIKQRLIPQAAVAERRLRPSMCLQAYANPCCGSFTIGNGRLSAGATEVPVETGLDKKSVFIIPENYFGVVNRSCIEIAGGLPMKLYVNRKSDPVTIEFLDTAAGTTHEFASAAKTARVR